MDSVLQRFAALAGAAPAEQLGGFLHQVLAHHAGRAGVGEPAPPPKPLVLGPIAEKAQRTAVHQFFKSLAGFPALETDTVESPGGSAAAGDKPALLSIQVRLAGAGGNRGQKRKWRQQPAWPAEAAGKRYVAFVMHKENMDSQQALGYLAKLLHVNHKLLGVAGTKDKRGVTVQQVTAFRIDPGRIAALNSQLRGVRVGNFEFVEDQLRLGDLQGNRCASSPRQGGAPQRVRARRRLDVTPLHAGLTCCCAT